MQNCFKGNIRRIFFGYGSDEKLARNILDDKVVVLLVSLKKIFNQLYLSSLNSLIPGIYVFLYHDITPNLTGNLMDSKVGTDTHTFETHLNYFKKNFRMISLREAVKLLASAEPLAERYGVITFDDAYRNIIENAVPLLDEKNIPATIFVCHNPATGKKGIWRQRLALLLDLKGKNALDAFKRNLKLYYLSMDDVFNWSKENYSRKLETIIDDIWDDLKMGREDLGQYATYEDLRVLENVRYEFGSHTISHPVLSRISLSDAREEIAMGHQLVESGLQKKLFFFAYPFGCPHHWNNACEGYIRELSGVYAVGAAGGINQVLSPLHIKRIGFTNHSINNVVKLLIEEGKRIS